MDGDGEGGVDEEGEVGRSRPSDDREQEEDNRELGGRSCKRRRIVEAAYDQKVGSREADWVMEGAGGPRRGRSKSASPLLHLLKIFVIATPIDPS